MILCWAVFIATLGRMQGLRATGWTPLLQHTIHLIAVWPYKSVLMSLILTFLLYNSEAMENNVPSCRV